MNFVSDGLCCKLGAEFAGFYEAVEQHKDDKDRCVLYYNNIWSVIVFHAATSGSVILMMMFM